MEATRRMSAGEAAATGVLAGLAGALAVTTANLIEQTLFLPKNAPYEIEPMEVVKTEASKQGVELSAAATLAAGLGAHTLYSAMWGMIYGLTQRQFRLPPLLHGLIYGELIWAANYPQWGILPRRGILPPASRRTTTQALIPVGTHAVFGLVTAAAFEALGGSR